MPRADLASGGQTDITVASAARTTTGNSGPIDGWGSAKTLRAQLNVSAASGTTPTLDVLIEDSIDGGATWNTVGTFAQKNAISREVVNVTTPFAETLRVRWTIAGTTPSFTFEVRIYSEN
jgi:hypothetical protein